MKTKIILALILLKLKCILSCSSEEVDVIDNDSDNIISIINESFVDLLNPYKTSNFKSLISGVQKVVHVNKTDNTNPKLQQAVDEVLNNTLALDNSFFVASNELLNGEAQVVNDVAEESGGALHTGSSANLNVDSNLPIAKGGYDNNMVAKEKVHTPEVRNKSMTYDSGNDTTDSFWEPSGRRLFHGEKTLIADYPFMATVLIFDKFQCAGSIVKSDLVLTAASGIQLLHNNRFYHETPKVLSVRVGSTFYIGGGEVVPVSEIYFHPDYVPNTLSANLAMLRLSKHLIFTKHRKRVKKIRIDERPNPLSLMTEEVLAIGWGAKTSSNRIYNPWVNRLSTTTLRVYPLNMCREVYSGTYVTEHNFCAGFVSRGGGACNRDVGGPGVVDGKISGVISFGPTNCGEIDAPTVFVRVGDYMDWISSVMDKDIPSLRLHVKENTTTSNILSPPTPPLPQPSPLEESPLTLITNDQGILITTPGRVHRSPSPLLETPSVGRMEPETSPDVPENATVPMLDTNDPEVDYEVDTDTDSTPTPDPNPDSAPITEPAPLTVANLTVTTGNSIDFAPIENADEIYDKSIAEELDEPFNEFGNDEKMIAGVAALMSQYDKKGTGVDAASHDSKWAEMEVSAHERINPGSSFNEYGNSDKVYEDLANLMSPNEKKEQKQVPGHKMNIPNIGVSGQQRNGPEKELPTVALSIAKSKKNKPKKIPAINFIIQANVIQHTKKSKKHSNIADTVKPYPLLVDTHTDNGAHHTVMPPTTKDTFGGNEDEILLRDLSEENPTFERGLTTPDEQEFTITDVKAEVDADEIVKYLYDLVNEKVESKFNAMGLDNKVAIGL